MSEHNWLQLTGAIVRVDGTAPPQQEELAALMLELADWFVERGYKLVASCRPFEQQGCECAPPNILNEDGKKLTGSHHYPRCPLYRKEFYRDLDLKPRYMLTDELVPEAIANDITV